MVRSKAAIIDSLQRELSLLNSGNLTWRSRTSQCELIKTIQEYVDPGQWPNYQVFVVEYKASVLIPGFKNHDSYLDKVNTAAREVFVWLLNESVKRGTNDSGLLSHSASNRLKLSRLDVSMRCVNPFRPSRAFFRQNLPIQVPPELPPENPQRPAHRREFSVLLRCF